MAKKINITPSIRRGLRLVSEGRANDAAKELRFSGMMKVLGADLVQVRWHGAKRVVVLTDAGKKVLGDK